MVVDNKFNIGDIVYLKTDKDQSPRMVTALHIKSDSIQYLLSAGSVDSYHQLIEISPTENELMKLTK